MDLCITGHGAIADGRTPATAAIQAAIEACHAGGGGRVRIPPGRFLSATIALRSGVTLELAPGARLIGSSDPEDYDHGFGDGKDHRWQRALILAIDCEDVGICGQGVIDGNAVRDPRGEEGQRGPHTVISRRTTRFHIRDVTIVDSGNYALLFYGGRDHAVRGVLVEGGWDGVHWRPDGERFGDGLAITDCRIHSGDDAVAGSSWHDVVVANCVLNSSCNGVRVIGPGRGLHIVGCHIYGPGRHPHITQARRNALAGILLQPGGWEPHPGHVGDIRIADCSMHRVSCALACQLKHTNPTDSLDVSGIDATAVYRAAISVESWGDTPWEQVSLRGIDVAYARDGEPGPDSGDEIGPPHVDARALPVWGLYARGVRQLELDRIRLLRGAADDPRPALRIERVSHLTLGAVAATPGAGGDLLLQAVDSLAEGPRLVGLPAVR